MKLKAFNPVAAKKYGPKQLLSTNDVMRMWEEASDAAKRDNEIAWRIWWTVGVVPPKMYQRADGMFFVEVIR